MTDAATSAVPSATSSAPAAAPAPEATAASPQPAAHAWYGDAPEPIQKLATEKGWKNAAEALEAYQVLAADHSRAVIPPKPDAEQKDWREFLGKLGVPAEAKDYGLARPEGLDAKFPFDDGKMEAFSAKAHELGLLPWQVKALFNWDVEHGQGALKAYEEASAKAIADNQKQLKVAWGANYDKTMEGIKRALGKHGAGDKAGAMASALAESMPDLALAVGEMAKSFSEDTAGHARGGGATQKAASLASMFPKSAESLRQAGHTI